MGLAGHWYEVMEAIRNVIPVYDKVNRAISLGKDLEYRQLGIMRAIRENDLVLDAGSGYGNMSRMALGQFSNKLSIVMLDPMPEMLARAKKAEFEKTFLVSGIFEHLPFKDNTFDAVMCGYSFRDAIRYRGAIAEFHRILRKGGRLVIVDIGKPDSALSRLGVSFYLKYMLGIIAFFTAGSLGLKFRAIYGTYQRLPRNSELHAMLSEKFEKVEIETRMMGGAVIVAAHK